MAQAFTRYTAEGMPIRDAADSYPMLLRCATYQLPEDPPMFDHLLGQHREYTLLRPNLMMLTGPPGRRPHESEHGTLVPMLCVKAG